MWPFFWLKAAAVKVDDGWHLVVFSLSGQWSDNRQGTPVDPPRGTLAAISKRLDAASAWQMARAMATTKTLKLAEGIVAAVPDVVVSPGVIWQDQHSYVDDLAADVAEPATWWFLTTEGQAKWVRDAAQHGRLYRAIRPTLDSLGETSWASFISTRFAGQRIPGGTSPAEDSFSYHLDLPLPLRVTVRAFDRAARTRRIEIDCHAPLRLSELEVSEGNIPRSRPQAHTVKKDAATRGGWAIGHVSVASTTNKLRIASPQLGRILSYEFSVPTREEVVGGGVRYLYAPHDAPGRGAAKWEQDLTSGVGPAFEVALLNAIARFGIVVLFAGQLTSPEGQVGGTATPGFDLLALDYRNRRAVAISAKGAAKVPPTDHLDTLRRSVDELGRILHGWLVFGLVVCHATHRDLARWTKPDDLNVWGQEQLAYILQASTAHAIAGLLWVPPWAPDIERRLYPMVI
jgi:hypothetical protein